MFLKCNSIFENFQKTKTTKFFNNKDRFFEWKNFTRPMSDVVHRDGQAHFARIAFFKGCNNPSDMIKIIHNTSDLVNDGKSFFIFFRNFFKNNHKKFVNNPKRRKCLLFRWEIILIIFVSRIVSITKCWCPL